MANFGSPTANWSSQLLNSGLKLDEIVAANYFWRTIRQFAAANPVRICTNSGNVRRKFRRTFGEFARSSQEFVAEKKANVRRTLAEFARVRVCSREFAGNSSSLGVVL
ncbi:MAG: hypothetical protein GY820_13860 [Gammaproteobacteria bacterium]|nr:hypothetical protein [Gammaproteobacteria bacterium]